MRQYPVQLTKHTKQAGYYDWRSYIGYIIRDQHGRERSKLIEKHIDAIIKMKELEEQQTKAIIPSLVYTLWKQRPVILEEPAYESNI